MGISSFTRFNCALWKLIRRSDLPQRGMCGEKGKPEREGDLLLEHTMPTYPALSPPRHGSSPAPNVCGGAQRSISLATGTFTGESRRNPLGGIQQNKCCYINALTNHDLGVLDSFAEAREATLRKPPEPESTLRKPGRLASFLAIACGWRSRPAILLQKPARRAPK